MRRPTGVSEGEGPWGPRGGSSRTKERVLGGESGGALKRGGLRGPGCGEQGARRGRTRTDVPLLPEGLQAEAALERGRERQGGRRVLLRTDFARAASRTPSPQGRDFAPPSPSTSPRRGASAPASSQGRPRLPAREPAARPQVPSVASGPGSPRAHLAHGHPRLTEPRHLRLAAQTRDACAARSARVHGGTAAAPLGKRRQLPASSAGGPTRTALHRERWEGPGNYFF